MNNHLKLIAKIIILIIMMLCLNNTSILANPIQEVENRLTDIGVDNSYIEAILGHLKSMELSEDDVNEINENLKYILENTKEKTKVTDCSLSQLYNLYNKGMNVAKGFDLKLSMNFFSKELCIKNSDGNTLFASEFEEIEKLYKNYLILGYSKEEDIQYLVESFRVDSDADLVQSDSLTLEEDNNYKDVAIENSKNEIEYQSIAFEELNKEEIEEDNIYEEVKVQEVFRSDSEFIKIGTTIVAEDINGKITDLGMVEENNNILSISMIGVSVLLLSIYRLK